MYLLLLISTVLAAATTPAPLDGGEIAAIAIGGVLFLIIVIGLLVYACRHFQRRNNETVQYQLMQPPQQKYRF